MSDTLYLQLIRLAHREPETRPHLLPLLEEYSQKQAARFRMPAMSRSSYLPDEVANTPPLQPKGTNLTIWTWELGNGTPMGIAFKGKAQKPLWYHKFRSPDARRAHIQKTIDDNLAMMAAKQKEKDENKKFQANVNVGDIFASSWGYNQTNVDFYEVVGRSGKTLALVRQVSKKVVSSNVGSEKVVAVPGKYIGPPLRRKVLSRAGYVSIKIDDVSTAYAWDGRPKYQTPSGGGH